MERRRSGEWLARTSPSLFSSFFILELDLILTSFKLEVLLKVEQELKSSLLSVSKVELKSSLLLVSKVEAAEVEVSRWQAAAPLASDSAAKKWAVEWSPR